MKLIYDAHSDTIYLGYKFGKRWFLFYENDDVIARIQLKFALPRGNQEIVIIGTL